MSVRLPSCLALLVLSLALPAQQSGITAGHPVLASIDQSSSTLRFLDSNGGSELGTVFNDWMSGMAYDHARGLLYVVHRSAQGESLSSVDPHTNELAAIGLLGTSTVGPIASHPLTGELYMVDSFNEHLWCIDRNTGVATRLAATASYWPFSALAFHPFTQELYGVRVFDGTTTGADLYRIDIPTGAIQRHTSTDLLSAISFAPDGRLFGIRNEDPFHDPDELVSVDFATGVSTHMATLPAVTRTVSMRFVAAKVPSLSASHRFLAGQSATISLAGGLAEADTWFFASVRGPGLHALPPLGVILGIASPAGSEGPVLSSPSGRASIVSSIPPRPGLQVWLQAAQIGVVSDILEDRIH